MKRIFLFTIIVALLVGCNGKTEQNNKSQSESSGTKFSELKSGMIEYEIKSSGEVLGMKVESNGTSKYYFKDWGRTVREEEEVEEKSGDDITKNHKLTITKNDTTYDVNFDIHQISKMKDMRLIMLEKSENKDFMQLGEEMMKSMGGKKVGTEKIKGYKCDVWEVMGGKSWVYKGLPLKTETEMMGMKRTEIATKIKFDTSVADSYFELPEDFMELKSNISLDDVPTTEEIKENLEMINNMKNMTFEEWKKQMEATGEELKGISDEDLRKTYEQVMEMMNAE